MTDLRQAAQQALEALEYASTGNRRPEIIGPAITALKAALEQQQAKPVQELEYAWPTIADYERDVGFKTNEAFCMAWNMARTTNKMLGHSSSPQQQAEPVAKYKVTVIDDRHPAGVPLEQWGKKQAEPVGEVTAAVDGAFKCEFSKHLPVGTKLYTTSPQRKPLTDEQVKELFMKDLGTDYLDDFVCGIRAAEAAHGIKEGT